MGNIAKTKIADRTAMEIADVDIEENNGHSGYFIVAFVDLLGTDARNTEIKAQPEFPAAMLEQEVRKVRSFQRNFYRLFQAIEEDRSRSKSLLPENLRDDLDCLGGNEIASYAFSDSIVFHAPLTTQLGKKVPVESVFNILRVLACVQLWHLSREMPFRGGVEIGRAAVFDGKQILGPALSDAVELEKRAQFPCIVVGKGVREYVGLNFQPTQVIPGYAPNRKYAGLCTELLCESDERSQLCEPGTTDQPPPASE